MENLLQNGDFSSGSYPPHWQARVDGRFPELVRYGTRHAAQFAGDELTTRIFQDLVLPRKSDPAPRQEYKDYHYLLQAWSRGISVPVPPEYPLKYSRIVVQVDVRAVSDDVELFTAYVETLEGEEKYSTFQFRVRLPTEPERIRVHVFASGPLVGADYVTQVSNLVLLEADPVHIEGHVEKFGRLKPNPKVREWTDARPLGELF